MQEEEKIRGESKSTDAEDDLLRALQQNTAEDYVNHLEKIWTKKQFF